MLQRLKKPDRAGARFRESSMRIYSNFDSLARRRPILSAGEARREGREQREESAVIDSHQQEPGLAGFMKGGIP
jgi:hypothetical protein